MMKAENIVVKANKIIESSYKMTLAEQRVLLTCIAKIDSFGDSSCCRFEISAIEINHLMDLNNLHNSYTILKLAVDTLIKRQVVINDPDPDIPETTKRRINWLSSIDYQPGEGKVFIEFTPRIMPYLTQLSKEFTRYNLKNIAHFKSTYSIRLYELLMQWQSVGKREIEVAWFKTQLQVVDNYLRISDFKNRVIDVAVKEINQHSNITVSYTQRKKGRVITHFIFSFALKKPQKPKLTQKYIQDNARPGESWTDAAKRLSANLQTGLQPPPAS